MEPDMTVPHIGSNYLLHLSCEILRIAWRGLCKSALLKQRFPPLTMRHSPTPIDLIPSSARSLYISVFPGIRQRRQEFQVSLMGLQQHLRDPCCGSKVSVDLERRMRVEQIGIYAASTMMNAVSLPQRASANSRLTALRDCRP